MDELEKRLVHANISGYLLAPARVELNKEFNMRLDLVNVAKNPAFLTQIMNLLPSSFRVISVKPLLNLKDGSVDTGKKQIAPFQDEAFTLTVQATESGAFELNPQIVYIDDLGESKVSSPKPVTVLVKAQQLKNKVPHACISNTVCADEGSKPFNVFLCYKKSSGKDFADHLKTGLEELGLHSFLDSKDIPQMIGGEEEWAQIRDQALEESRIFILIMTPGFNLSSEVIKELNMARKSPDKQFIYFRHRNMGRKFLVNLDNEILDFSKQEQVSFETKEELLRLAHNILFKDNVSRRDLPKDKQPKNDSEIDIVKKYGLSRSKEKTE
jgi:hypothetical protein